MYKAYDEQAFVDVADAIRAKTGKSAQIEFPTEFVSEIGSISGGGEGFPFPIRISSYWVLNGMTMQKYSSPQQLIPSDESGQQIEINTNNSHRFGIAVKMDSLSKHAILTNGNTTYYSETPGIELQQNGNIGFGIPGSSSSWARWINLSSYSVNEWVYCEYEYNKQLDEVTIKVTKDFINWTEQKVQITPYGVTACHPAFSGWSGHADGRLTIDFSNTFIESNGTIVWGKYKGTFPE